MRWRASCERGVGFAVDLLVFEGSHEALGFGVVVRIAGAAHADAQAARLQSIGVGGAGILHAAVRVMDQAGRRVPGGQGHVERFDRQARFEMVGERPAHDPAREGVEDHGEIDELPGQTHVSDVGRPDLIEAGGRRARA